MTEPNPSLHRAPFIGRRGVVTSLALLSLALLLVLYVSKVPGGKDAPVDPACVDTAKTAERLRPLVHGEIAALALARQPKPLPELSFAAADGTKTSLADFKGQTVLFNLWATWCVPCRQEMPALDRLQGMLGSKDFGVVAVNIDTARLDRPKAFLNEIGIKNLKLYTDDTAASVQTLKQSGKVLGLPTTILIGRDGCEIGTLAGPAQWDSQDAMALLNAIQG
jgi:thiol-disulfide isomerase/thioredoxin